MVASFRTSVTQWLDQVLPADLYVRAAGSTAAQDAAFFEPTFVQAASQLPGIAKLSTQRTQTLLLQADRPPVTLIARSLEGLPLVGEALAVPQGQIGIFVSEAMVDLQGARPGTDLPALSIAFKALQAVDSAGAATFFVAGVWRDYARQFGTIAIATADFERLTGDRRVNDMALWLTDPNAPAVTEQALRALADRLGDRAVGCSAQVKEEPAKRAGDTEQGTLPPCLPGSTPQSDAGKLLEFASSSTIRAISLKIFDRSFAVTYWLQAVAIGIGLFGVAASFSAQVLARRKEFGLLVHLGLTRGQVLRVVALEGLAWTTLGAVAGLGLGLAVSVVLVKVVNPQSFHWTMELSLPTLRLGLLAAAVVAAGTLTAWLSARAAAGRDAVLSVKEDW